VSPGIGVKLYPCCYFTHLAIDAALHLRDSLNGNIGDLKSIDVSVSPGTMMVLRKTLPESGLEGKFSMEYCVAAALHDGEVKLATFTDEAVARPELKRLTTLVRVTEDGPPARTSLGGSALVSVETADDSRRSSDLAEVPRGDPQNPLSWEQLCQKFEDCAKETMHLDAIGQAIKLVDDLDGCSASQLTGVLTQSPTGITTR
jgi:2-methylcitrate dehydratase PrpD